jgi:hypothetical protein
VTLKRTPLKRGPSKTAWTPPKPKGCHVCRREFQPTTGFQRYCSRDCAAEADMETVVCEFCGTTTRKRKQSGTPGRFCSVACSAKATGPMRGDKLRKVPIELQCAFCSASFTPKRRADGQRFCSRRCLGLSRRRNRPASRSLPKGWGLTKKGEGSCRNCGQAATHLHHIVPRSKSKRGYSEVEANGLPLCYDCHRGWHDRIVPVPHRVMTDEEFGFAVAVAGGFWVEHNYADEPLVAFQRLGEVTRARYVHGRPEAFDERLERVAALGLIECWTDARGGGRRTGSHQERED